MTREDNHEKEVDHSGWSKWQRKFRYVEAIGHINVLLQIMDYPKEGEIQIQIFYEQIKNSKFEVPKREKKEQGETYKETNVDISNIGQEGLHVSRPQDEGDKDNEQKEEET